MNYTPVHSSTIFSLVLITLIESSRQAFDQRSLCDSYCQQYPEVNLLGVLLYGSRGQLLPVGSVPAVWSRPEAWGHLWGDYLNHVARTRRQCFQRYPELCRCSSLSDRIVHLVFNPYLNLWQFISQCKTVSGSFQSSEPRKAKPGRTRKNVQSNTARFPLTSKSPWTRTMSSLTTREPPTIKSPSTTKIPSTTRMSSSKGNPTQRSENYVSSFKAITENLVLNKDPVWSGPEISKEPLVQPVKPTKQGRNSGRADREVTDRPLKPLMGINDKIKYARRMAPPNKPWRVKPITKTRSTTQSTLGTIPPTLSSNSATVSVIQSTPLSTPATLSKTSNKLSTSPPTPSTTSPTPRTTTPTLSTTWATHRTTTPTLSTTWATVSLAPQTISTLFLTQTSTQSISTTSFPLTAISHYRSTTSSTLSTTSTTSTPSTTTTATTTTIKSTSVKRKLIRKLPS